MNVVDSSGWIEYFTEGPNAGFFAGAIEDVEELLVPALVIYEVFKWISRERGETLAVKAAAHMQQGEVVDLDAKLAAYAARLSLQTKLPMADSIVHATARVRDAILWTQDDDFEGLGDVKYVTKKKGAK
ncbi:MAG: type II toxin-antitoxin system VapC family toxin [Limisphaerales bacterium]